MTFLPLIPDRVASDSRRFDSASQVTRNYGVKPRPSQCPGRSRGVSPAVVGESRAIVLVLNEASTAPRAFVVAKEYWGGWGRAGSGHHADSTRGRGQTIPGRSSNRADAAGQEVARTTTRDSGRGSTQNWLTDPTTITVRPSWPLAPTIKNSAPSRSRSCTGRA